MALGSIGPNYTTATSGCPMATFGSWRHDLWWFLIVMSTGKLWMSGWLNVNLPNRLQILVRLWYVVKLPCGQARQSRCRQIVWLSARMTESFRNGVMSHLSISSFSANKRDALAVWLKSDSDLGVADHHLCWSWGHDLWLHFQTLPCSTGMLWTAVSCMTTCQTHSNTYISCLLL
jgi:hypothetical protein